MTTRKLTQEDSYTVILPNDNEITFSKQPVEGVVAMEELPEVTACKPEAWAVVRPDGLYYVIPKKKDAVELAAGDWKVVRLYDADQEIDKLREEVSRLGKVVEAARWVFDGPYYTPDPQGTLDQLQQALKDYDDA